MKELYKTQCCCTLLVYDLSFPVSLTIPLQVLWLLDLQAEVYVLHRLVHGAGADDVDLCNGCQLPTHHWQTTCPVLTVQSPPVDVGLGDVPATLQTELAFSCPPLLETASNAHELRALDVVEHDNVRSGVDRLVRLRLRADLDFEQEAESPDLPGLLDRFRDGACIASRATSRRSSRPRAQAQSSSHPAWSGSVQLTQVN